MNSVFHALGDATRRQMLRDLADGERTVSDLAKPFAMSLAAASKHIRVLEGAGLIRREVRGRTHGHRRVSDGDDVPAVPEDAGGGGASGGGVRNAALPSD